MTGHTLSTETHVTRTDQRHVRHRSSNYEYRVELKPGEDERTDD